MCGIAGFVSSSDSDCSPDTLQNMARAIAHRGPDDEGFFTSATNSATHRVGLAHRRLSIIDLDSGHQPLGNEDQSIKIVFNGEIYNFKKLRKELIARGHRFVTNSDTETIVHAYEEYGAQCVDHLRGMFAFAIWDSNRERLFLARDRFGKKPLFLYQQGGNLHFASEIKSLLTLDGIDVRINPDAVLDYLLYRYVPCPYTLFSGIEKLPPACYAIWEKGELRISRYYVPPDLQPYQSAAVPGNPVDDFLQCLDDAVSCRMISDVPFGAFLSGGIDSSAIVGLMSRHSELPIKSFSVGFAESAYSELGYARTIAEQYGTDHSELVVSQDDLMNELPALVRFRDAPVAEPSDIPIYLLSKEARKTVKMVLTGEGSDEVLGGYPKHVYERFAHTYQLVPGVLRKHVVERLINALPFSYRRAKTAISTLGLTDHDERMARWFGAMSIAELRQLTSLNYTSDRAIPDWKEYPASARSPLRSILSFDQTSWLPDNLLERGDRMTMAASLEARMPFLDHLLADYVSSLPDKYRVRGRKTKWLLREAMKQLLPKSILERPKVGFRVPVNEWFRGPMKDYLFDHLAGNESMTRDYFRPDALARVLDEHSSGLQNHEKLLWSLLNLEIWHREYLRSA